jgi:hypothetical protein
VRPILIGVTLLALVAGSVRAQEDDQPPDAVIQVALEAASDNLGVPIENLVVVAYEQHDWPDSAIGCPMPGRAYAQIITDGYIVTIDTDDLASEVQVHTDRGSRGVIC